MNDKGLNNQFEAVPVEGSASMPAESGDKLVLDQMIQRKYTELKGLAKRVHWRDPRGSLTATALLSEAYLRLSKKPSDLAGKGHDDLLAIFAHIMWEILVDQARSKQSLKRGSGNRGVSLNESIDLLDNVSALPREDVLTLKFAREELQRQNPRAARVLDCRFSLGMTSDEAATVLNLSKSTVERESRVARDFLLVKLHPPKQLGQ